MLLRQDGAGIDGLVDLMPGDAMRGLPGEDRPGRGMEAGMSRQGAIVKVDRPAPDPGEHGRWDHVEIADAEQEIHRRIAMAGGQERILVDDRDPGAARPFGGAPIPRDHGGDRMPAARKSSAHRISKVPSR